MCLSILACNVLQYNCYTNNCHQLQINFFLSEGILSQSNNTYYSFTAQNTPQFFQYFFTVNEVTGMLQVGNWALWTNDFYKYTQEDTEYGIDMVWMQTLTA